MFLFLLITNHPISNVCYNTTFFSHSKSISQNSVCQELGMYKTFPFSPPFTAGSKSSVKTGFSQNITQNCESFNHLIQENHLIFIFNYQIFYITL